MAAQGFFLLFLICCTAAVYAEGDVDDQEHPTDLPARAVFEVFWLSSALSSTHAPCSDGFIFSQVGKAKTHGMRYMKVPLVSLQHVPTQS